MEDDDLNAICKKLTSLYAGKSILELHDELSIDYPLYEKGIGSKIARAAFQRVNKLDVLPNQNTDLRTIQLYRNGAKKFDMKLFMVDFYEIKDKSITFEKSQFYKYFTNTQIVFALYEIPQRKNQLLKYNIFLGFKPLSFDKHFIETNVKETWLVLRDLVLNNKLRDIRQLDRAGMPIINQSGTVQSAPNFPKSKDFVVFLRGGGKNSADKKLVVNGISMLKQYAWVRGDYIAKALSSTNFI